MLQRAREASRSPHAEWWNEAICDERFRLITEQLLHEVQKYWKRLRKAGLKFKYLVVFERHKSGLPHVHWLLHECEDPIPKRELQAEWPFGHTKVKLVGGKSADAARVEDAGFYVCKYLSKTVQARVRASQKYLEGEMPRAARATAKQSSSAHS